MSPSWLGSERPQRFSNQLMREACEGSPNRQEIETQGGDLNYDGGEGNGGDASALVLCDWGISILKKPRPIYSRGDGRTRSLLSAHMN